METSNKIVSMVFYPVVFEINSNMEYVLNTDGEKVVEKDKDQVSWQDDYYFVTEKDLLNIGTSRIERHN